MKKAILFPLAILAVTFSFSVKASAQSMESGYFLDNYTYSYRLNPAIMPDNNFVAIGIGNLSTGVTSKFGISSFLFKGPDGNLVTGLHKSVSSSEFLSKFSMKNMESQNINVNLFSFGIRKENSMSTVEMNLREDLWTSVPRDLFAFLKDGSSLMTYDLSPLRVGADAMIEITLGHTRRYDNLVFGLRAKLLFGAAGGEMSFDRFDLTSNQGELGVSANSRLKVACLPLNIVGSPSNPLYVEDISFALSNMGVAGFGIGFDLGAKWYVDDNLSVTFGLSDLGAVSWKYNNVLGADFDARFEGLENVDMDTDVEKAFDDFLKGIEDKAKITAKENSKELAALPFSINAGTRYRLPFYDRLSVGALVNYNHSSYGDVVTARAGATVTPVNWFSLSGNIGYSNYGGVAGCMASLTIVGLNLFAGFDCYCGKCSAVDFGSLGFTDANLPIKNMMFPLNAFQYRFSTGITIQFGKRRADYIRQKRSDA